MGPCLVSRPCWPSHGGPSAAPSRRGARPASARLTMNLFSVSSLCVSPRRLRLLPVPVRLLSLRSPSRMCVSLSVSLLLSIRSPLRLSLCLTVSYSYCVSLVSVFVSVSLLIPLSVCVSVLVNYSSRGGARALRCAFLYIVLPANAHGRPAAAGPSSPVRHGIYSSSIGIYSSSIMPVLKRLLRFERL